MITFKFATIKENNKLLFDGDTVEVTNRYYRNALYTPSTGDRVLFLYDTDTKQYVLQGRVIK